MSEASVVYTRHGAVRGMESGGVVVWRGVPFAQPPLGTLRFRPPQPPQPWSGVRDATAFGPACPQPAFLFEQMLGAEAPPTDEDCLTLNVWSPAADAAHRPVLVWIHGGAFVNGSGSTAWYDGESFARDDTVVVTLNYRLGPLGFLALDRLSGVNAAGSGNCGLLDQVAALGWVRENIAAFGGDPANVTVFGESAGAMSIGALLGTPAARGLFQKAVLQSGAAAHTLDLATATATTQRMLDVLGVPSARLEDLQALPVERIIEAAGELGADSRDLLLFEPVVDDTVLPRAPLASIAAGSASGISLLLGTNHDEMNLYVAFDPSLASLTDAGVLRQAARLVGEAAAEDLVTAYRKARPGATPGEVWSAISTDATFRIPAIRLAEAQAHQDPGIWMYRFDWRSPALNDRLGACHALELPFVWNNLAQRGVTTLTGDGTDRQAIADRMHASWVAFARAGDPTAAGQPSWPAYDLMRRATKVFDVRDGIEEDPGADERVLWEGLSPARMT